MYLLLNTLLSLGLNNKVERLFKDDWFYYRKLFSNMVDPDLENLEEGRRLQGRWLDSRGRPRSFRLDFSLKIR